MVSELRISVITVCYNAERTIEKAIRSLCSQIYSNIEYIIIDGNSTDKTIEIVNKYSSKISRIISEKDEGIFDAMNKGLSLSSGDIIYFLNADDYFYDDFVLADVARVFVEDDSRYLVFGNVVLEGGQAFKVGLAKPFKTRSISEFLHNSFCHQAYFVRRAFFSEIGFFDCRYKYAADYVWVVKAFKSKPQSFFFLNRNIAYYFYNGCSRQNVKVASQEARNALLVHFFSLELLWFLFRYRLIRNLKKFILKEPN